MALAIKLLLVSSPFISGGCLGRKTSMCKILLERKSWTSKTCHLSFYPRLQGFQCSVGLLGRAVCRSGSASGRDTSGHAGAAAKGGAVRCPKGLRRRGSARGTLRESQLSGTKMVYATVISPFV